jgi:hypothetical protein
MAAILFTYTFTSNPRSTKKILSEGYPKYGMSETAARLWGSLRSAA